MSHSHPHAQPYVSWLPTWLALSYVRLYGMFRNDLFSFSEAQNCLSREDTKLVLSLLRRKGWLTVFGVRDRKRLYRAMDPVALIESLALKAPVLTRQPLYSNLIATMLVSLKQHFGERLASIAYFGSVARGTATADSDLDVLVVGEFRGDTPSRIDELAQLEYSGRLGAELAWLSSQGINCHISWFPLTPHEASRFRPLYLDMLEDAVILYDRDSFLASVFAELRKRILQQGGERIWLDKERWYWKIDPRIDRELLIKV